MININTITGKRSSYIESVLIQCQASIYTLSLCGSHSCRAWQAKQETLTPPGHMVSPLVCRGPLMSTVVLYCWCHSDSASGLLHSTFSLKNAVEKQMFNEMLLNLDKLVIKTFVWIVHIWLTKWSRVLRSCVSMDRGVNFSSMHLLWRTFTYAWHFTMHIIRTIELGKLITLVPFKRHTFDMLWRLVRLVSHFTLIFVAPAKQNPNTEYHNRRGINVHTHLPIVSNCRDVIIIWSQITNYVQSMKSP